MGGNCCVPKDSNANDDLRNAKKGIRNTDNIFKKDSDGPEFTVTNRDSFGMAAKEHTENLMKATNGDANSQIRNTNMDSELNTNNIRATNNFDSSVGNCYQEGTFVQKRGELP